MNSVTSKQPPGHPQKQPPKREASRRVGGGAMAEIRADRWRSGCYELIVDGTPQSHVDLGDPRELNYEYVRRIGHVIDQLLEPGDPITALHLGAGALTLPRYVAATRPGSRQQVIELDRELMDLVREQLPWDRQDGIRIRYGDARAMLARLPAALRGCCEAIVVDVFSGARIPAHVTSLEFYRELGEFLSPSGVLLANIADGPPMAFARSQAATVAAAIGNVAALAEAQVLKGRRFGNIVLAASANPLPMEWLPRLLAAGPHPARVISHRELASWIGTAAVATDETATGSPQPSRGVLRMSS